MQTVVLICFDVFLPTFFNSAISLDSDFPTTPPAGAEGEVLPELEDLPPGFRLTVARAAAGVLFCGFSPT